MTQENYNDWYDLAYEWFEEAVKTTTSQNHDLIFSLKSGKEIKTDIYSFFEDHYENYEGGSFTIWGREKTDPVFKVEIESIEYIQW